MWSNLFSFCFGGVIAITGSFCWSESKPRFLPSSRNNWRDIQDPASWAAAMTHKAASFFASASASTSISIQNTGFGVCSCDRICSHSFLAGSLQLQAVFVDQSLSHAFFLQAETIGVTYRTKRVGSQLWRTRPHVFLLVPALASVSKTVDSEFVHLIELVVFAFFFGVVIVMVIGDCSYKRFWKSSVLSFQHCSAHLLPKFDSNFKIGIRVARQVGEELFWNFLCAMYYVNLNYQHCHLPMPISNLNTISFVNCPEFCCLNFVGLSMHMRERCWIFWVGQGHHFT